MPYVVDLIKEKRILKNGCQNLKKQFGRHMVDRDGKSRRKGRMGGGTGKGSVPCTVLSGLTHCHCLKGKQSRAEGEGGEREENTENQGVERL